jgi:hypothetical protein
MHIAPRSMGSRPLSEVFVALNWRSMGAPQAQPDRFAQLMSINVPAKNASKP